MERELEAMREKLGETEPAAATLRSRAPRSSRNGASRLHSSTHER